MIRTDPEVGDRYKNIPTNVLKEIRELFTKCYVNTTFGGTAYGHTRDKKVADRLQEGWVFGEEENRVALACNLSVLGTARASRDENASTYYDFNIPAPLVSLVREINDGKNQT